MDHLFDEFSKSLAESVPRRESLRRLGAVFAGAVLSPLGIGAAWAATQDPCKAFCKCRNPAQQNQCLAACRKCNGNTSRLAGKCGSYTCCAVAACKGVCSNLRSNPNCGACGNDCRAFGQTCCGHYCADLANDFYNCGACGHVCDEAALNEFGACVAGTCMYDCAPNAVDCSGACTFLDSDPDNCGACGNVCPSSAPVCIHGTCSQEQVCTFPFISCGGVCVDPISDRYNCGGCGIQCGPVEACISGFCESGA
jgi:hypothetical protein